MRVKFADQYNINCVVPEPGDTADEIVQACRDDEAIWTVDGEEFCVELRADVGPELWTEESLRRSVESADDDEARYPAAVLGSIECQDPDCDIDHG